MYGLYPKILFQKGMLLTGGYEDFYLREGRTPWAEVNNFSYSFVSLYHVFRQVGVYACGIAVLLTGFYMMWYSGNRQKLAEQKQTVTRKCIIIIGIFGVAGIISLIQKISI